MFAKDIMNKCAVICTEEMSLIDVYQLMLDSECEYVPVVESNAHNNPTGVITEHDICLQIIAKGRSPRSLTAASVMNAEITKTLDTSTVSYCENLLQNNRTKRLFVVDENGAFCGVISSKEIESGRAERPVDAINRSAFLGEYRNPGINRIF